MQASQTPPLTETASDGFDPPVPAPGNSAHSVVVARPVERGGDAGAVLASVDIAMAASPQATQESIGAFARTDFRDDLTKISVPTLVIHGDSDGIVPFDVSGRRAAEAIESSTLVVIEGAPHGFNATHAEEFNRALLEFLRS